MRRWNSETSSWKSSLDFAQMLRKDVVGMYQRQMPHRSFQSNHSFTMSCTFVVRAWPENWMQRSISCHCT